MQPDTRPPAEQVEDILNQLSPQQVEELHKQIYHYSDVYNNAGHRFRGLKKLYAVMNEKNKEDSAGSSCKKGCAFCCSYRIETTEVEAELIVHHCRQNNIPIDTDKLEQVKDLDIKQYMFSPHKRCTFLSEENTCKIYDVRPMSCRNYYVFSEAKYCNIDEYPDGYTACPMKISSTTPVIALMKNSESASFANQLLKFLK